MYVCERGFPVANSWLVEYIQLQKRTREAHSLLACSTCPSVLASPYAQSSFTSESPGNRLSNSAVMSFWILPVSSTQHPRYGWSKNVILSDTSHISAFGYLSRSKPSIFKFPLSLLKSNIETYFIRDSPGFFQYMHMGKPKIVCRYVTSFPSSSCSCCGPVRSPALTATRLYNSARTVLLHISEDI